MTKTTYTVKANVTIHDIRTDNDQIVAEGIENLEDAQRLAASGIRHRGFIACWVEPVETEVETWEDEMSSPVPAARIERRTYRDESGERVHQIATRSKEVRCDGWLI